MGTLFTQHVKNLADFSRVIAATPINNDLRPKELSGEQNAALYMSGNPDQLVCPKCNNTFSRTKERCAGCHQIGTKTILNDCSNCHGIAFLNPTGNCVTPACGFVPPAALGNALRCPTCK